MGTNEKMQAILDEALRSKISDHGQKESLKMRRRLQLYGCGSGAVLPRVNKMKRPQTAYAKICSGEKGTVLCYTSKECENAFKYEHEAWYRTTRGKDERGKEDAEKLFIGCIEKRQQAGIGGKGRTQKWYGGRCPSGPVSSVAFADAVRYGARGTKKEREYRQHPNTSRDNMINEWTPPLTNVPHRGTLYTPRLWPENANYVTGFGKKQNATSHSYRSQTTVADIRNECKLSTKLERLRLLDQAQMKELAEAAAVAALPPRTTTKKEDDCATHLMTLNPDDAVLTQHNESTLSHEWSMLSRSMRYLGPQTLIVSSGQKTFQETPHKLELRWHQVACLYACIKSDRKNRSPQRVFEALTNEFKGHQYRQEQQQNESKTQKAFLPRHAFVDILHSQVEHCSKSAANLLCTLLDEGERGRVEYAQLLGMLFVLNHSDVEPVSMLLELWDLHCQYGASTKSTARRLEAIFATCAQCPQDLENSRIAASAAHTALVSIVIMRSSPSDRVHSEKLHSECREQQPDGIFEKMPATLVDIKGTLDTINIKFFSDQLRAVRSLISFDELTTQPTKEDMRQARDKNIHRRISMSRPGLTVKRPSTSHALHRPSLKTSEAVCHGNMCTARPATTSSSSSRGRPSLSAARSTSRNGGNNILLLGSAAKRPSSSTLRRPSISGTS